MKTVFSKIKEHLTEANRRREIGREILIQKIDRPGSVKYAAVLALYSFLGFCTTHIAVCKRGDSFLKPIFVVTFNSIVPDEFNTPEEAFKNGSEFVSWYDKYVNFYEKRSFLKP